MQISVWYIVVAALLFFVFGAGIAVAIDAHLIAHWRKSAKAYEATLSMFQGACRAVLSDAFFKKVLRRFREDVERRMAEEQGKED